MWGAYARGKYFFDLFKERRKSLSKNRLEKKNVKKIHFGNFFIIKKTNRFFVFIKPETFAQHPQLFCPPCYAVQPNLEDRLIHPLVINQLIK